MEPSSSRIQSACAPIAACRSACIRSSASPRTRARRASRLPNATPTGLCRSIRARRSSNSGGLPRISRPHRERQAQSILSRLPLSVEVDEIILIAAPKEPRIALINEVEGFRVTVEWGFDPLERTRCCGSRTAGARADLGRQSTLPRHQTHHLRIRLRRGVSAAENQLTEAGYATAVDLLAGETYVIRHRIAAERID